MHSNNDSVDNLKNSNLTQNARKRKRKSELSSQNDDRHSEHSIPNNKPKKTRKDKKVDSHLMNTEEKYRPEMFKQPNEEAFGQDNTPMSLKKQKRPKKKKTNSNPIQIQSNTSTLDYLIKWKSDKSNWKFEKVKQKRLISITFDTEKVG